MSSTAGELAVCDSAIKEPICVPESCPVCASPHMGYARHTPTRRTRRLIPVYACFRCKSLSNPSGYVEDEAQLKQDLEWNLGVAKRNRAGARSLFRAFAAHGIRPRRICEIGAGTGTTLAVAQELGIDGIGYDLNRHAVDWGREHHGLDLRAEHWNASSECGAFDLMLCVSTFEHIEQPRGLFAEIARRCREERAFAFISVPYVNDDRWSFLLDPDPDKPGTPFFDQDVHVTHFSHEGMRLMAEQHGATAARLVTARVWSGHLMSFCGQRLRPRPIESAYRASRRLAKRLVSKS